MTNQSSYKRELILQSYDFESASLPRGMVRACSLSHTTFLVNSVICFKILRF